MCRLRDPLNERRENMVKRCFHVLDTDRSGVIDSTDLKGIFNCSHHPDVISGKLTQDQVFKEFLTNFEGTSGNKNGQITWDEWKAY